MTMVYCRGCGKSIHSSAIACPQCGAPQAGNVATGRAGSVGAKSRTTAAILAFFLGGFGIHKFYLDRVGAGILYLLFCWTLIPAFVAFIEFIVYLTMTDEAFSRKYDHAS